MTSFLIALAALVIGYAVYGKLVDSVFGPTDKATPAIRLNDGVDYVPLPTWKVFMIQLLNIAGLGPIFGALSGALWGRAFISGSCSGRFSRAGFMTIFRA